MPARSVTKIMAILTVLALLLPGCLDRVDRGMAHDDDIRMPLEPVAIDSVQGCDNMNPIHCMLPFPSDAFLQEDNTTTTGYRVNYASNTLPDSGSFSDIEISGLNLYDGMSPSTQIFTAFHTVPDLSDIADQYSIANSLEADHPTILLNLDTGERVAHWVEVDARATDPSSTLVFIRTIEALNYDTSYGVAFSGLIDDNGNPIHASKALQAVLDGVETTSEDVEERRGNLYSLIRTIEVEGYQTSSLQAVWSFHIASEESVLGGMLTMRTDALERLGDDGIGCTVTSSEDNYGDDDITYRRIRGTFTAPQYVESQAIPSLLSRSDDGTPQFVENADIPYTIIIPQILADLNESGPLVVFGHGFLGEGESAISDWGRHWNQEYKVSFIATDLYGWSSSDFDTIALGLVDPSYFQHQAERLQQALINKMSMIRTFKGVCSDLAEMHHNGTNLVDTSDVHYMGYSLGGIYGASVVGISPDIDRAALWVGGSGFSTMVERSTNFADFQVLFSHAAAYPARNDRAILTALIQQLLDPADPERYLVHANEGTSDITPFSFLSIISTNDAQVPGLASDRAARNAGVPVLDSSARLPYGLTPASGPIDGSAVVYWDGGYDSMPDDNSAPPVDDSGKAHNEIAPIVSVNEMVRLFLLTGVVNDTCDGTCTFDYETDSVM